MKKNQPNQKRDSIINSTLSLFGRTHNVKKVSLEDIARAAGVSPTTIYNIFGNRENLLIEAVKVLVNKSLEDNRRLIQSDLPFPQKMAAIVSVKRDLMDRYDNELIEKIVTQDEGLRPFIDEVYANEVKPLWAAMLQEGKNQGYIDNALSDEAMMIYLDAIKAGFSARKDLLKDLASNPELMRGLMNITFFGFLKRDMELFKED